MLIGLLREGLRMFPCVLDCLYSCFDVGTVVSRLVDVQWDVASDQRVRGFFGDELGQAFRVY